MLPEGFVGPLDDDEQVLATAGSPEGSLVATSHGLWVPESDRFRRIGWHLLNKVTWRDGSLNLIECSEIERMGSAMLVRDGPRHRFRLTEPGKLPDVVHTRVTGSIRSTQHRDLSVGGARFVQRKVPGQDGIQLQVRADSGADERAVADYARNVADRLDRARESGQW